MARALIWRLLALSTAADAFLGQLDLFSYLLPRASPPGAAYALRAAHCGQLSLFGIDLEPEPPTK